MVQKLIFINRLSSPLRVPPAAPLPLPPSRPPSPFSSPPPLQRAHTPRRSEAALTGFLCKAAVPKYMQVQITPPSETTLLPDRQGEITQTIRLSGVDKSKALKVRLRIEYDDGESGKTLQTVDLNMADLATEQ